jgi:hypothetical protein
MDGDHARMQDRQRRVLRRRHLAACIMRHTAANHEPTGELTMTEIPGAFLAGTAARHSPAGYAQSTPPRRRNRRLRQADRRHHLLDPGES